MSINDQVEARGIREVLHFTSNHGFVGCLHTGSVISRRQLPSEEHLAFVAAPTAQTRQEAAEFFDKAEDWLDYVNLSISEINARYFRIASTRWHVTGDRWWLILSFRAEILSHDGVYFATTNNVYPFVERGRGEAGFSRLFQTVVKRKPGWDAIRIGRADGLPTCEQAEVLYPRALSLDFLEKVYVRTVEEHDAAVSWLAAYGRQNVVVEVNGPKFVGQPN